MTSDKLAQELGVTTSTIDKWVRNDRAPKWSLPCMRGVRAKYQGAQAADNMLIVRCDGRSLDAFRALARGCDAVIMELKG